MADKKALQASWAGSAYPGTPQAPAGFVPTAPASAYGVHGATPYGIFPTQAGLYAAAAAAQGPPPTYEQSLAHQVVGQQVFPSTTAASMYAQQYAGAAGVAAAAAAGYPLSYPAAYAPMQAYYPAYYPSMQAAAAQLRTPVLVPNGYDTGARFDGMCQPVIPPPPPGVAPNAAQLAAMAGHNVAVTQKKGSFLTGGSDGGYTFW